MHSVIHFIYILYDQSFWDVVQRQQHQLSQEAKIVSQEPTPDGIMSISYKGHNNITILQYLLTLLTDLPTIY